VEGTTIAKETGMTDRKACFRREMLRIADRKSTFAEVSLIVFTASVAALLFFGIMRLAMLIIS